MKLAITFIAFCLPFAASAESLSFGVGMHLNNLPPRTSFQTQWPSRPFNSGFHGSHGHGFGHGFGHGYHRPNYHDHGGHWHHGFERESHLGLHITTPRDRWHSSRNDFDYDRGWSYGTPRLGYFDEPSFEFRAEPRRARVEAYTPPPRVERFENVELIEPIEPYEADDEDATLHYCASAQAYYPAVKRCPGGWERQTGVRVQ